jgi:general secretion pathway protein E
MELSAFTHAAIGEGMRPLRLAGAEKIAQGLTTVEEVLSILPHREG